MARLISRSKNSHMRSPRSVTLAPMALPSRSLKPAIDFLALVTSGFWPVITREVGDRALEQRRLLRRPAHAHVDDDLLEARDLHDVAEAELLLQLLTDLAVVALLQPWPLARLRSAFRSRSSGRHQTSPPHFRQMRTLLPSASNRYPTRVRPHVWHTRATLDTGIGMSLSMIPPCMVARAGAGAAWRC